MHIVCVVFHALQNHHMVEGLSDKLKSNFVKIKSVRRFDDAQHRFFSRQSDCYFRS